MARADVLLALTAGDLIFSGGGTQYTVETAGGVFYQVFVNDNSDIAFRKSTDGITWGIQTTIFTGSTIALAVWYDRWSGIAAGLIHCAYSESANDDTFYRTINVESSDALSTETTIFAGLTSANGGSLTLARSRGGNVYCNTVIDAGVEGGFFKLLNANVPNGAWEAALANPETLANADKVILMPGWAADTHDMMAFFWDASADELSRYLYDDSANTWGETSIAASMVDAGASTNFPHSAAAVDITNSRNLLVAWSAVDTLNADLRCWHVTESAITEVTNVVLNSTDDQGLCAIGIDTVTEDWYVFYAGKSDGSETFDTAVNVYYKVSTDDGVTWGAETQLTTQVWEVEWLVCTQRFTTEFLVAHQGGSDLRISVALPAAGGTANLLTGKL